MCDEKICHCVLYFDWIISKYKDHPCMHRVPKYRMKQIIYHEYEQVSNFVQYVHDRNVGHIKFPVDPHKRRVVPQCLESMVENWVMTEYGKQYTEWCWGQDIDSRVKLSGRKRTYSNVDEACDAANEDRKAGKEPKVPQFDADDLKKRYEEEVQIRYSNQAFDPEHCPLCSVQYKMRRA